MEDYFKNLRIRSSVHYELSVLKAKTGSRSFSDLLHNMICDYEGGKK